MERFFGVIVFFLFFLLIVCGKVFLINKPSSCAGLLFLWTHSTSYFEALSVNRIVKAYVQSQIVFSEKSAFFLYDY